jgi:hypothetical protein
MGCGGRRGLASGRHAALATPAARRLQGLPGELATITDRSLGNHCEHVALSLQELFGGPARAGLPSWRSGIYAASGDPPRCGDTLDGVGGSTPS